LEVGGGESSRTEPVPRSSRAERPDCVASTTGSPIGIQCANAMERIHKDKHTAVQFRHRGHRTHATQRKYTRLTRKREREPERGTALSLFHVSVVSRRSPGHTCRVSHDSRFYSIYARPIAASPVRHCLVSCLRQLLARSSSSQLPLVCGLAASSSGTAASLSRGLARCCPSRCAFHPPPHAAPPHRARLTGLIWRLACCRRACSK
jgi:hypothetical protein